MHHVTERHIFESRLYIERNLGEGLSGELIAQNAFLSYFHYQHQFKVCTGESVWQYVKRLRMERACFLLAFTSLPVSDIAYQINFESSAAFSKAFRSWHGMSPQKYRLQSIASPEHQLQQAYDWNKVKIRHLPEQVIAAFRSEGATHLPKGYFKWQQFTSLLTGSDVSLIGRSPDQPGITPLSKLRWDTALPSDRLPLELKQVLKQEQLLFEDTIPAGKYLVVPFAGFGRPFTAHFPHILTYLRNQGLELSLTGCFFQELRQHAPGSQCLTDLYIPIR
ncbi:AraC family transcriptional regulator [Pontibacter sp. MBLB2868]|uniref:AraC family transcriptional regulator n=1 Tax=Pontibacter sp. MBLB2868 TaxID=3451555 RepID=UPI003F7502EB